MTKFNFLKRIFNKKESEQVSCNCDKNCIDTKDSIDTIQEPQVIDPPEYIEFDEDMVNIIANILRPIIKDLNTCDTYIKLCDRKSILEQKLKTYKKLSEDNKTLTITLTQSKSFNKFIANIVDGSFVYIFKEALDALKPMKFEITSEDGNIFIKRSK